MFERQGLVTVAVALDLARTAVDAAYPAENNRFHPVHPRASEREPGSAVQDRSNEIARKARDVEGATAYYSACLWAVRGHTHMLQGEGDARDKAGLAQVSHSVVIRVHL